MKNEGTFPGTAFIPTGRSKQTDASVTGRLSVFSLGCNLVLLAGSSIVSQQTVDERRDVTDVHDAVVIDVGRIFAEERV